MSARRWLRLGLLGGVLYAARRWRSGPSMAGEPRGQVAIAAGLVLGALGLLLSGFGLMLDPSQAYLSYLTAYVTGLSLVLGTLMLVMISNLTGAAWFQPLRGAAESVAATMPLFAVLFLPLLAGMHMIYPWASLAAEPSNAVRLAAQRVWLAEPFFLARAGVYFAVWIGVGLLLRRWSASARRRALSAGALPAVGLTLTFAAFDWMMSLTPDWSSTIYGAYVFAGGFLAALAVLAAVTPSARAGGLLGRDVPADTFHSLGNLLLTFVIFWAYLGFAQLLIIWIADLPGEVSWYVRRLRGSWGMVAALLLLGNFVAPLLLLLFRGVKRHPARLASVGVWLLAMHYLDVYWLVMPQLHATGVRVHWLDLATLSAVGGLGLAYGAWQVRREALAGARAPAAQPAPGVSRPLQPFTEGGSS